MIAFMVVDLPAPLRPSSAMVSPCRTDKADAEQDLAGAVIDVEILDLHDRLRAHTAAPA